MIDQKKVKNVLLKKTTMFIVIILFVSIIGMAIWQFTSSSDEANITVTDENNVQYDEISEVNEIELDNVIDDLRIRTSGAVFTVYAYDREGTPFAIGSGFFVCHTGIAITNHHVMHGQKRAQVRTLSGERFNVMGYYSYCLDNDIAILQVDGGGRSFNYLDFGEIDNLERDDPVFAFGSPLGIRYDISSGRLSSTEGESIIMLIGTVYQPLIYTISEPLVFNIPIAGGNSGGPLLNNKGEVIGVITARGVGFYSDRSYAVRIDRVIIPHFNEDAIISLPISPSFFVGTWRWAYGYYVFHEDGTGRRDWGSAPGSFEWFSYSIDVIKDILGGSSVIHIFQDERWTIPLEVSVLNQNWMVINGFLFRRLSCNYTHPHDYNMISNIRNQAPSYSALSIGELLRVGETLDFFVGFWTLAGGGFPWFGGMLLFNADGTGWMNTPDYHGFFLWGVYVNSNGDLIIVRGNDLNRGRSSFIPISVIDSDAFTMMGSIQFQRSHNIVLDNNRILVISEQHDPYADYIGLFAQMRKNDAKIAANLVGGQWIYFRDFKTEGEVRWILESFIFHADHSLHSSFARHRFTEWIVSGKHLIARDDYRGGALLYRIEIWDEYTLEAFNMLQGNHFLSNNFILHSMAAFDIEQSEFFIGRWRSDITYWYLFDDGRGRLVWHETGHALNIRWAYENNTLYFIRLSFYYTVNQHDITIYDDNTFITLDAWGNYRIRERVTD